MPAHRPRPLFTVGVMDIPQLEQSKAHSQNSWIACTTDDVLGTKPDLYDLLVLMPRSESQNAPTKIFPRLVVSTPEMNKAFPKVYIKSTQRDFQRYVHLLQGLRRLGPTQPTGNGAETSGNGDTSSVSSRSSSYSENKPVVESSSWSRVAYTSLIWWASAGDRRGGFAEPEESEAERDSALLHSEEDGDGEQIQQVALVAYFHRMTALIFQTIATAVARTDGVDDQDEGYHDDDDEDDTSQVDQDSIEQRPSVEQEERQALLAGQSETNKVEISQEDMAAMGLDSWSASDKRFVEELTELWWRRKAVVRAGSIECCGLRIL